MNSYGVPMLLVHMVSAGNSLKSFSQLHGLFRIAFEISAYEIFDVTEGEHFATYFEYERFVVEGQMF